MLNMMGIGKNGIKAGRLVGFVSATTIPVLPSVYDGANYLSPVGVLAGQGNFAARDWNTKIKAFLGGCLWNGLGIKVAGLGSIASAPDAPEGYLTSMKALSGYGIAAGVGMSVAGRFVNPMLAGSPVKM